jgi:signal transduction histidine kinase
MRRYTWLGLSLFMLFTAAAAFLAVERIERLARANERFRDHPFTLAEALLRAHEHAHALHNSMGDHVIAGDLVEAGLALAAINEHERGLNDALTEVVLGSPEDPHEHLRPLFLALSEWRETRERVGELLADRRWSDAAYVHHTEGEQAYRRLFAALGAVIELERGYAVHLREQSLANEREAEFSALLLALMAGGSLAVVAFGALVFLRTHQPLTRLRGCLLALAGGDTSVAIPYLDHTGTVGAIASAVDGFRRSMIERDSANEALKRSEERMRQAVLDAQTANDSKSRFLAAASHDLRQPLQALRLFLDLLDTRIADPKDRRILSGAIDALAAGEGVLRNYLDVSVLEAGILAPVVTDLPLRPVLNDLMREFAPEAEAKGLTLRMVGTDCVVRSDAALLQRLLRNLVSNAIRYTDSGGVLLGCRRQGDTVRIEVWDTGIGIAADKLDAVFEDFYQVGNSERDRTRGLGLGLSVVDRAARLLHHQITARSRVGKGSVFSVALPLAGCKADRAPLVAA